MFGYFVILILTSLSGETQHGVKRYTVYVDTSQVLSVTEDEFLSFTLDFSLKGNPEQRWYGLDFDHPRVKTLAKGLSPAHLRFGGTDGDFAIFYDTRDPQEQQRMIQLNSVSVDPRPYGFIVAIFPDDIDKLYSLAKAAAGNVYYAMNIELRYGAQWDSTNARLLLDHIVRSGYSDMFHFELGNEPPFGPASKHAFNATGERIARDFAIFRRVLNEYPDFVNSKLVGPDLGIVDTFSGILAEITRDFATYVQGNISAFTLHQYYFRGPNASLEMFYNLSYFLNLEQNIPLMKNCIYQAMGPVDLWFGETSDSYLGGTPGITNTFASGFLWLDKLGLSAREGFKMVFRQTFYGYNTTANYPLITTDFYPNPDYWLSYVFKNLVGRPVFSAKILNETSDPKGKFRVYAHCTSTRTNYTTGSIVIYGNNINELDSAKIDLTPTIDALGLRPTSNVDFYLLTPENGNLTSTNVLLNSKLLRMTNDSTLPQLIPRRIPSTNIIFPPLSFGFIVIERPSNNIKLKRMCTV